MDFFNDLLTSYSLLKKRKLRINLQEAYTPTKPTPIPGGYSDLERLAEKGDQIAIKVKSQVDTDMTNLNPQDFKGGSLNAKGELEAQGPFDGRIIAIAWPPSESNDQKGSWTQYGQQSWRNQLAWQYYEQSQGGAMGIEAGEPLDDNMRALLADPNTPAILNLNSEDSTEGSDLVAAIADIGRIADTLGIRDELFSRAKGNTAKTTIPSKINESLFGTSVPITTEAQAERGEVTSYERPLTPAVIGSLQNLNKVLLLVNKSSQPGEKITQDELDFLKDNVRLITFQKGGYDKFRLFVKSNLEDEIGLSFDWDVRDRPTALQTQIAKLEHNLEVGQKSWGLDDVSLPYVDRQEVKYKDGDGAISDLVGNISEDIDTILVLMMEGRKKEAGATWDALYKKFQKELFKAFELNEATEEGHLIGTDQTTLLNQSIADMQNIWSMTKGKEDVGHAFGVFVNTIFKHRHQDMMRMSPDFVARVGGREAGKKGRKVDQVLFYTDRTKAEGIAKKYGSHLNFGKLGDITTPEELKKIQDQFGKHLTEDMEVSYINDSLKWTKESARTNLGSTASPLTICREFQGDGDYPNSLLDKLGVRGAVRTKAKESFKTLEEDIKTLNKIFYGEGSTSVDPGEAAQTFIQCIDSGVLSQLGISDTEVEELKTQVRGAKTRKGFRPEFVKSFIQKMEYAVITSRIKNGSNSKDETEAKAWRTVGASILMRGCYDASESDFVVQDYITGEFYRYNGNKKMTAAFKKYIKTGEGWSNPTGKKDLATHGKSFNISGYTANFAMNKKTGTTSFNMTGRVYRGKKPVNSSTEYSSTELMHKLLEVQELMFSHLIKE